MFRQLINAALLALSLATSAMAAVDANQASTGELESVKGIGPALSAKITAARQQGAFKDWADLVDRVSGLGPGNAQRLSQGGLTVGGSAYAATAGTAMPATSSRRSPRAEGGDGARATRKPAQP